MDDILKKFRSKFIDEANSLLDKLEGDLLLLEKNPNDKDLIESAFRAMHTIKGVSSMYGFDYISEYTHLMESIYQNIREGKMPFNQDIFNITFESIDHIRKLLLDEKLSDSNTKQNHDTLKKQINLILSGNAQPETQNEGVANSNTNKSAATFNILLSANEHLYFRGISITGILSELAGLGNFYIEKAPITNKKNEELWSIFLSTEATYDEVSEVLMFIEDDCIIKQVASEKLLDDNNSINVSQPAQQFKSINAAIQQLSEKEEIDVDHVNNEPADKTDKLACETTVIATKQAMKRISVDAEKLDQLMFLVSELITVNSQLLQDVQNPIFEPLKEKIEKIDDLSKLFRDNAIELRLVPLSDTILRFQRLIRDLSNHLNKKVELKTQGIENEIDKNTVDQLAEPLMHIIRNCIDHGIETPEIRSAKGKAETGTIEIKAYQSGNYIIISISDDGTGIDLDKIRKKAVEKGFVKTAEGLTDEALYDLIFLPGFSTAQSLTDVSGRGVGMDVVRRKINDLHGEVIVKSEPGVGTSFILKIQQSLSILDSLLFKVEDCYFTIPVSEVEECDELNISMFDEYQHTSTLSFNNNLISFLDLRKALKIKGSYDNKAKEIVIRSNEKNIAILADSIIGKHQAVLKPLGKAFNTQQLFSAASQLGDGNIAFMLDTNVISKNLSKII
jgi:two-component system chemotaxis sensor kinase CheA